MITIKTIQLKAHQLSEQEMKKTKAGVDLQEYCCVLFCNVYYNASGWSEGAIYGANYGAQKCIDGGISNGTCKYKPNTCEFNGMA